MSESWVLQSVLLGNGITAALIYGLWRIRRNEADMLGMVIMLIVGLIIAAIGYLG